MNDLTNSTAQVLIEKLLVAQPVKRFFALKEPEGSLPCSQQLTSGSYTDPDESSPRPITVFLRYLLILSSHVRLSLPGFSAKNPSAFIFSSYVLHASPTTFSLICSHFSEEYKSWISSLCHFLHPPIASSLLGSNTSISTLFSNTPSLCSSIQVAYSYKTTSKIVV